MLGQSIKRNTLGLCIFAVLTAGIIAITQQNTATRISDNIRQAQAKALNEILPQNGYNNDLLTDILSITDAKLNADGLAKNAYIARQDGQFVAVVIPSTAADGYSGKIHSIVGIDAEGKVTGVRVLSHKETPGLGDKVEIKKSDWITQFNGKSLLDPAPERWAVTKDGGDFDQLTGATITPRAVIKSVYRALEYFELHRETLLTPPKTEATELESKQQP